MKTTYAFISAITIGTFSLACSSTTDDDGTVIGGNPAGGAPAASGGAPAGSGGSDVAGTGGDAATGAGSLFDGDGTWVEKTENTVGIQGSFFVLEDSMKGGLPVEDSLQHTDLSPDEFDDATEKPCVSGTVAKVTASDGVTECGFGAGDEPCDFDTWGGGIGFNLDEPGGENSVGVPWSAVEHGVTGFKFNISNGGFTGDIRFKATMEGSDQDFCTAISDGDNSVLLTDLKHMCWGSDGTETLDTTKLLQLQWQLVTKAGTEYSVTDFCVNGVEWF